MGRLSAIQWVLLVGLAVLTVQVAQRVDGLKLEDLSPEEKEEAMRQREMLTEMLGQLEGLTEEETKQKIMAFTPQQRDLLKAYYEHKHKQHADTTAANAKLTPEQQQEMLKDLYKQLEDKSFGEQEAIKKKWTAQQKDLFTRYEYELMRSVHLQEYQKKMQEEYAEKRAQELGACEYSEMYPHQRADGDTDWEKPVMGRCRRVHIWDEAIGDSGARALANEILAHPNLFVALSLDTTEVGADGAAHLGRMVKGTSTLEVLDVDSNTIGDAGAKALAEAAANHPALSTLGLAHNDITDDGASALLKLLRSNYKITALPLQGNSISAGVLKSIEELLEKNRQVAAEAAAAAQNASDATGASRGEIVVDDEDEETVVVDEGDERRTDL